MCARTGDSARYLYLTLIPILCVRVCGRGAGGKYTFEPMIEVKAHWSFRSTVTCTVCLVITLALRSEQNRLSQFVNVYAFARNFQNKQRAFARMTSGGLLRLRIDCLHGLAVI